MTHYNAKYLGFFAVVSSLMACGAASPAPGSPNQGAGADAGPAANLPDPAYGLSDQSVDVGADTRDYVLYIPESYTHDNETPVMLNFHGGSMDANGQIFTSDMRSLADAENFILVYPEGSPLETGESHWNPLPPGSEGKSDADDFGFVSALLDALEANYRIDTERVYATGYSNGAGMAYGLACYLSDRITAIAPVSGSMYVQMQRDCAASHPTAVAIFNGTNDFARPYDGYPEWFVPVDEAATFWAEHNQTSTQPQTDELRSGRVTVERKVYSGGEGDVSVVRYKVFNGDHDWFDLDLEGRNLDQLIWDFVSAHSHQGLR